MTLDPRNPEELIVILITLSPFIWLVRWALRQKPRNYFVILGTVTVLLCFSFAFFVGFLPRVVSGVLLTALFAIALVTISVGAAKFGTGRKTWKPLIFVGLTNGVLFVLFIWLAPGNTFGPFIIVGILFVINTLATVGLVLGRIVQSSRRAH